MHMDKRVNMCAGVYQLPPELQELDHIERARHNLHAQVHSYVYLHAYEAAGRRPNLRTKLNEVAMAHGSRCDVAGRGKPWLQHVAIVVHAKSLNHSFKSTSN